MRKIVLEKDYGKKETFEKWKGGQGRKELELIFNNKINELKDGAKKWRD